MAQGDQLDRTSVGLAAKTFLYQALLEVVSTNSGTWFDASQLKTSSIEFSTAVGSFSALTAKVMGSNSKTKPLDATDGFQIGADITALGAVAITMPARWIKVKVTACTPSGNGKLNALLHGMNY